MYASIDGYVYSDDAGQPDLLDRWILSRYHSTAGKVGEYMDAFDPTRAARLLQAFVMDELSNWYVRRSRRRFWKGEMGPDKAAAYHTLYTVLDGLAKLLAPFTPFLAEEIYRALRNLSTEDKTSDSVHLELYPDPDRAAVDQKLERHMEVATTIASAGRTVRNEARVRVRQPLSQMVVYAAQDSDKKEFLEFVDQDEMVALVLDELNIREIAGTGAIEDYVRLKAKPNFPALGKKYGKRVPQIVKAIEALDEDSLKTFKQAGEIAVDTDEGGEQLTRDELSVRIEGKDGYGASEDGGFIVILNLGITEELRLEGLAREVVNRLQNLRKDAGLEVTDRIRVRYAGGDLVQKVFTEKGTIIENETLARETAPGPADWENALEFSVEGEDFRLWLEKVD
jgi:isoleucyl-tRNA synthetase